MGRAIGHAGVLGGQPHSIRLHRYPLFLLLSVVACTGALVLAISLRPASTDQRNWLFDVTNGPHVAVSALPGVDLQPVTSLPGATASSGPFSGVDSSARYRGRAIGLYVEARPLRRSAVDRPALLSGSWLSPGAIVLQRDVADRLAATPGSRIQMTTTTGALRLRVAGIADTTIQHRYPAASDGVGYVLPSTLGRIAPDDRLHSKTLLLRLDDPDASSAFAAQVRAEYGGPQVSIYDWRRP